MIDFLEEVKAATLDFYKSIPEDTIYKGNAQLLRGYKSLTNRFLKVLTLPAVSWLRFSTVPLAVALLYPNHKKNKGGLDVKG